MAGTVRVDYCEVDFSIDFGSGSEPLDKTVRRRYTDGAESSGE
jgi:hypothetical protein